MIKVSSLLPSYPPFTNPESFILMWLLFSPIAAMMCISEPIPRSPILLSSLLNPPSFSTQDFKNNGLSHLSPLVTSFSTQDFETYHPSQPQTHTHTPHISQDKLQHPHPTTSTTNNTASETNILLHATSPHHTKYHQVYSEK